MAEEFSFGERGKRMRVAAFSIVAAWIGLVLLLGFFGYGALHFPVSDRIYFSLQLLFLHAPELPTNTPIQIARFLAPGGEIIGLMLGIAAAAVLWTDSVLQFSMKFRKHVVVCGLGRKGLQLVQDFRKQRKNVLVIEKDKNNPFIELCDQLGAVVLIGDAAKKETLHRAYLGRTEYLVAACGEDGANVDIAMLASQIYSRFKRSTPLVCFVHIVDTELRELLRQQRLFDDPQSKSEIRIFNIYENSARILFQHYHLDHTGPITEVNDPRQAHLIVFGFGRMGESVLLQAAKMAHFPNGEKLRVTVIDQHAHAKRDRFLIRYPAFQDLCDPSPIESAAAEHNEMFIESIAENPALLEKVKDWCAEEDRVTTCVVAFDNDSHSMSFALGLWGRIKQYRCPILVRVASDEGLSRLLSDVQNRAGGETFIRGFGKIERASSADVVVNEQLNQLARWIHEDFQAKRTGTRKADDPSIRKWEQLDSDFKESNWQQAEHIPFKLRIIHCGGDTLREMADQCSSVRAELIKPPDDQNRELQKLAQVEHRRWMAERSLAGWKRADKKDVFLRTHPDLKPWDELSVTVKQYDVDAVKKIPDLLDSWSSHFGPPPAKA